MLLIFGYAWACVDDGGNIEVGKWTESVVWIMVLSERQTLGTVVVGCKL